MIYRSFWLILAGTICHFASGHEMQQREMCQWDKFSASCPDNSVIMTSAARYGRFAGSLCIQRNLNDVGCETDVLDFIDGRCSGRPRCDVRVAELAEAGHHPCSTDLTSSLLISYTCVDVLLESSVPCGLDNYRTLPAIPSGYISNIVSSSAGSSPAAHSCPWRIRATDGDKQVSVTMFDFGVDNPSQKVAASDGKCRHYAIIGDFSNNQEMNICGGDVRQRTRHILKSNADLADVRIVTKADVTSESSIYFLLHFEEVGCPTPVLPVGASLNRHGNVATIQCVDSRVSWQLKCEENEWNGGTGNCSVASQALTTSSTWTIFNTEPLSASNLTKIIALGCGIGVVIGFLLLGIGLVCIKRCNVLGMEKPPPLAKDSDLQLQPPDVYWTLCQHHQQPQQQALHHSTEHLQLTDASLLTFSSPSPNEIYDTKCMTPRSMRRKYTPMTAVSAVNEKQVGLSTFACGHMTTSKVTSQHVHVYDSPSVPCKCPINMLP